MKAESIAIGAVALAAGVAIGYVLPFPSAPGESVVAAGIPATAARKVDDTEIKSLRRQVKILRQMAEARAKASAETAAMAAKKAARRERDYKRLMVGVIASEEKRLDFFSAIDTSKMRAADLETHEKFLGLLEQHYANQLKLARKHELSEEERNQLEEDDNNMRRAISRLRVQACEVLFRNAAASLGFSGEAADEISETITEILYSTATEFPRRMRRWPEERETHEN